MNLTTFGIVFPLVCSVLLSLFCLFYRRLRQHSLFKWLPDNDPQPTNPSQRPPGDNTTDSPATNQQGAVGQPGQETGDSDNQPTSSNPSQRPPGDNNTTDSPAANQQGAVGQTGQETGDSRNDQESDASRARTPSELEANRSGNDGRSYWDGSIVGSLCL
jgi:hypothetical protein